LTTESKQSSKFANEEINDRANDLKYQVGGIANK
jgi:hypothetical protein